MAVKGIARVLLVLFFMSPMWVYALGLGEIKLRSSLEEPFDAEIELTSASSSVLKTLQVKLASNEDFSRVGIKPVAAVKLLRFEVVKKPGGGAAVHVTTPEPVHDPYLNFLIEANWGRGRVLREYTVLLDPPELAGEDAPVIEAPSIATVEPEVAVPPAVPDVLEVEPPPVAAAVVEPELPPVTDESLIEPEPLPPVDDEGLIEPEPLPEVVEPEVIEPEPLPEVAEPGLLEPEALPPVAEEGLLEPESLPEVVESEPVEPALEESSELAIAETEPVAAPEQDFFPDVGDVAVGSEGVVIEDAAPLSYSVERGDTLWSIAEQMRGDRSVSVYQVMMALFHNNPTAFINGNVNNLKAGSILRVEDEGELTAVSDTTAKSEFWQQYRAWQDYKQMLAENVVTQGDTLVEAGPDVTLSEKTYTAEEVADLAEASSPGSVQEGAQLTLVSPDEVEPVAPATETGGGEAAGEAAEAVDTSAKGVDELQAMRDEVLAEIAKSESGSAQNQALREKLAALEEQIASLQRVVSVKDTELAALQQKAAEETAQQPESTATEADIDQPVVEEGLMAKLNRSPQLMGILGGVVLLLLAWLWLMFRRRSDENEAVAAVVAGEGGAVLSDDDVAFTSGDDGDDVLAQADAYVDAGKHAAAAEVLAEAIKRDPNNDAYRYRLLDIHYEMKNKEGFSREAEELYSLTGGSDATRWGKVVAMGAALLPAHALFSSDTDAAEEDTGFDDALAAETDVDDEEVATSEWDDIELESELDDSLSEKDDEAEQLIGEVLGDSTDKGSAEGVAEEVGQADSEEASDDAWNLDFEIDEANETSETFLMEEEILDDNDSKSDSSDGIDFNLSGDAGTKVAAAAGTVAAGVSAAGGEVLEFTRRGEETDESGQPVESEQPSGSAPVSGIESVDQDMLVDEGGEAVAQAGDDLLEFDDELEDEEQAFPSFSEYDAMAEDDELLDDVDEIGTKLDLARAYIDMGDAEAARSMLDEVKQEGDNTQKKEAAELLEQIDA